MMTVTVDSEELEAKVRDMYRHVAQQHTTSSTSSWGRRSRCASVTRPAGSRTFRRAPWSRSPEWATSSTSPTCTPGECVVDLGSGSGMDAFYAAGLVGPTGHVYGVHFTPEQLDTARRLAGEAGLTQVEFCEGRMESLPLADASADCVISNGVINLCPDKKAVFAEAARVLKPGGRLAGRRHHQRAAAQGLHRLQRRPVGLLHRRCRATGVLSAGDRVSRLHHGQPPRERAYAFISGQARTASAGYGVKNLSLLATKTAN